MSTISSALVIGREDSGSHLSRNCHSRSLATLNRDLAHWLLEADRDAELHVAADPGVEVDRAADLLDDGEAADRLEVDEQRDHGADPLGVAEAGADQERALGDDVGVHAGAGGG